MAYEFNKLLHCGFMKLSVSDFPCLNDCSTAAEGFFAQPQAAKNDLRQDPIAAAGGIDGQGRHLPRTGYRSVTMRQEGAHEEGVIIKELRETSLCGGKPLHPQDIYDVTLQALEKRGREVLRRVSARIGLGELEMEEALLDPTPLRSHTNSSSYLSVIHYPSAAGSPQLRGNPHVDGTLLTLIYATQPGLHMRVTRGDGEEEWLHASSGVTVLAGAALARATAGVIPAAVHRVVMPDGAADRLAIICKIKARPDATLYSMGGVACRWKRAQKRSAEV
jgi:isopenicillin N synthase-like dioxygenase